VRISAPACPRTSSSTQGIGPPLAGAHPRPAPSCRRPACTGTTMTGLAGPRRRSSRSRGALRRPPTKAHLYRRRHQESDVDTAPDRSVPSVIVNAALRDRIRPHRYNRSQHGRGHITNRHVPSTCTTTAVRGLPVASTSRAAVLHLDPWHLCPRRPRPRLRRRSASPPRTGRPPIGPPRLAWTSAPTAMRQPYYAT